MPNFFSGMNALYGHLSGASVKGGRQACVNPHTCRHATLRRRSEGRAGLRGRCSAQQGSDPATEASVEAPQPGWQWQDSDDALKAYTALIGTLALGSLPGLRSLHHIELPYFITLASATIYIGAHRGLCSKMRQSITLQQGAFVPFAASAALFAGYLVVKFFPDLDVAKVLNGYFWFIGSIAVAGALRQPLRRATGALGDPSIQTTVPEGWFLDDSGASVTDVSWAPIDALTLLVGLAAATIDLRSGHTNFSLNNLLACLIATDILQLLGLKSFRAGAVMLAGLLLYDVFWVFGSPKVIGDNVMLTVATSDLIAGPTRLLFPRVPGGVGEASGFPFSLLGLGDVAVPGLLACLALRYDASRAVNMRSRAEAASAAISEVLADLDPALSGRQMADASAKAADAAYDRVADAEASRDRDQADASVQQAQSIISDAVLHQRTYFKPTMVAYVLGLGVAFAANAITKLGQPALLYLVPMTLAAISLTAVSRGEFAKVWAFTDTAPSALETLERLKSEKKK